MQIIVDLHSVVTIVSKQSRGLTPLRPMGPGSSLRDCSSLLLEGSAPHPVISWRPSAPNYQLAKLTTLLVPRLLQLIQPHPKNQYWTMKFAKWLEPITGH